VPTGFVHFLRHCRHAIIPVAIGLVVLQTLVASLAIAQAAAPANAIAAGVICHGNGGSTPAPDSTPDQDRAWNVCCTFCTSAAPVALPAKPLALRLARGRECAAPVARHDPALIAPRAVRAGLSQAPPTLA
jgi:hypothetical protein